MTLNLNSQIVTQFKTVQATNEVKIPAQIGNKEGGIHADVN